MPYVMIAHNRCHGSLIVACYSVYPRYRVVEISERVEDGVGAEFYVGAVPLQKRLRGDLVEQLLVAASVYRGTPKNGP